MVDAHELVGQIRNDLKPLDDRILRHPYLEGLEAGRLERADLRTFAGQQYHIVISDLRSIAHMVSRQLAPPRPLLRRQVTHIVDDQHQAARITALCGHLREPPEFRSGDSRVEIVEAAAGTDLGGKLSHQGCASGSEGAGQHDAASGVEPLSKTAQLPCAADEGNHGAGRHRSNVAIVRTNSSAPCSSEVS